MNDIYKSEKQRRTEAEKLRTELYKLGQNSRLSDPDRFEKILYELSIIDSIGDRYNFNR